MKYLLILAIIFSAFVFSACEASTAQFTGDSKKPLKTPQITTNRPKIIAFGDSLTAGFGLLEKESYPYLLQQKLDADGFQYEVINAGVSGDTSIGGLERVDWILEQEKVEILILELGANDLLRRMPVANMKRNLAKIIEKAQKKNVKVLLCGMLAPPSVGSEYQREYQAVFPDLATEKKVEFLPFLLENVALNKDLNQSDGIHPNAKGSVIMTENVYKALNSMLKK
ncbi:MAG TPA: arylesterase [Pyrinomonadaceae bacterium]|nr:arylesterase [Pyrinomonadaceae bacterium]